MGDAAINGVPNPSESFVAESDDGVKAAVRRNPHQQFGGVASSEHPMHGGEVGGALIGVEIRCEHATSYALPPEELARAARSAAADGGGSSVVAHDTLCLLLIWGGGGERRRESIFCLD